MTKEAKEMILIGGLGYGDEGKGTIVDYLARTRGAKIVVRYNGGAQAGHNVVTPDGHHHIFSQFGSGTMAPGVKTHLSRFMILNPLGMVREEEHLQSLGIYNAFRRMTIEENALITTPFQVAVNRLLEIWRDKNRYGSCGIGIGQTAEDYLKYGDKVLFAKDLRDSLAVERKLRFLQEQSRDSVCNIISSLQRTEIVERELELLEDSEAIGGLVRYFFYFASLTKIVDESYLVNLLKTNPRVLFEGAQGVLLDKDYGFRPHTTKTDITFDNAYKLLKEARYESKITRMGILRGYATRHGAGPFVTEDEMLTNLIRETHNGYDKWQGKFRIGWFDLLTARYGILIDDGVDCLAVTNLDRLSGLAAVKICVSYEYQGDLNILDPYFEWEPIGQKKARILAFKKPDINLTKSGELTQILLCCKPLEFIELPGWQQDITRAKRFNDLPKQAREYVSFLQSSQGLNTPVKIISVNPTWEGKILVS